MKSSTTKLPLLLSFQPCIHSSLSFPRNLNVSVLSIHPSSHLSSLNLLCCLVFLHPSHFWGGVKLCLLLPLSISRVFHPSIHPSSSYLCSSRTGFLGPRDKRIYLVLRGFIGSNAMILLFYAVQQMPLADATVIMFRSDMCIHYFFIGFHLYHTFFLVILPFFTVH